MKRCCYVCGGDGFIGVAVYDLESGQLTTEPCPACHGRGWTDEETLPRLNNKDGQRIEEKEGGPTGA